MRKLIITMALLFAVAIVLPELRTLLLVGCVCALGGFMVGFQRGTQEREQVQAARAARLAEAKG